ncbi:hypothetical protein PLESTB_000183600 [Pleodorina starrii]|uniref:UBC core domain-containing protein n=1 Tax=Pleodorina starrii TaxID=330485 RepID=A0A9W6EYI4_9CHLO|nr:hypothetical protein PLESTM_000513100 [Pleodorina starrii]GLC49111.1 hypothetical protein PLESTB_000183600 [Pleodorina starrii]GLC66094.1 hypothetical protein PLESTF_000384100 [Pleodorina starrii]
MAPSKIILNRIPREMADLMKAPPAGISAWLPCEGNLSLVEAQVLGPEDTPYAGGIFQLRIDYPDRYPNEPPNVKFKTKVYHPNVSHDGNICLSVINMPPKGDWRPSHNLRTVLLSIQCLLSAPNPDDPLDAEAARELKTHPHLFRSRAAEWTRLYANPEGRAAAGAGRAAAAAELSSSGAAGPSGAAGCEASGAQRQQGKTQAAAADEAAPLKSQPPGSQGGAAEAHLAAPPGTAAAGGEAVARKTEDALQGQQASQGPEPEACPTADMQATEETTTRTITSDMPDVTSASVPAGTACEASGSGGVQALSGAQVAVEAPRPAPKSRLALGKRARA